MKKFTLNWLKQHIDFYETDTLSILESIDQVLNKRGIEVEEMKFINGFIVVKIHYEERKEGLKVGIFRVKLSEKLLKYLPYDNPEVQVLSLSDNAKKGLTTILAPIGTQIKDYFIGHRNMKGNDSYGLFCSYDEIGGAPDGVDTVGLIETDLPENTIYRLEDVLIAVSTPTNRWDLMSVRGIARELAFSGLGELKPLTCHIGNGDFNIKIDSKIDSSMSFMKIQDIKIDPKIRNFMKHIGKEDSNDLKILNDFILQDIGHPIHIYEDIGIENISIDYLKANEKFTTLKNDEFISKGNEILIKMNNEPVCIGGMIGIKGFNDNTKNVIIEAGYFKSENIGDLITDAARLFHVGIDPEQETLGYVGSLILRDSKMSKLHITKGLEVQKKIITLTYSQFYRTTEIAISIKEMCENLKKYGFIAEIDRKKRDDHVNDEFVIECEIPSWRTDFETPEDIIEEILRIIDFEKYLKDDQLFQVNKNLKYNDPYDKIRNLLINRGFTELYTFPFASEGEIKILNSLNTEKSYLRNSLFESLKNVCFETAAHGTDNILLFEIGKIYTNEYEKDVLGIIIKGSEQRSFHKTPEEYDFWYLKKIIMNLSLVLNIDIDKADILDSNEFSYGLKFKNGFIGKIKSSENLLNNTFYAEISMDINENKFLTNETQRKVYEDISITLPIDIQFDKVQNILGSVRYYLFDYYEKNDGINYGITLIFNENDDFKNNIIDIKKQLDQIIKK